MHEKDNMGLALEKGAHSHKCVFSNSKTLVKHEVCELSLFSIKRLKVSTPHQGWVKTQSGQKWPRRPTNSPEALFLNEHSKYKRETGCHSAAFAVVPLLRLF
jgi:hypothetical protein